MKFPSFWQKQNNPYKYYSFLNGLNDGMPDCMFILDDVKLPALDVKHALRMYEILKYPKMKTKKPVFNFTQPPVYVRRVIEYELVKTRGHTIWQFKVLRNINIDMFF